MASQKNGEDSFFDVCGLHLAPIPALREIIPYWTSFCDKITIWKNDLAPFVDIYGFNLTPATSPRDIVFSLLKTFLLHDKIAFWQNDPELFFDVYGSHPFT